MEAGAELIARARLICGEQHVITHATVLSTYRSDGLRRDGPLPLAAILPGSATEVANLVIGVRGHRGSLCGARRGHQHDGDALPVADGVLVVLTRLRRILEVGSDELTVEPGVPVSTLLPLGGLSLADTSQSRSAPSAGTSRAPAASPTSWRWSWCAPTGARASRPLQPGYDLCRRLPGIARSARGSRSRSRCEWCTQR